MSPRRRAELEERINNLRTSMAVMRNAQDRFTLASQVGRLEAELAELQGDTPLNHAGERGEPLERATAPGP